MLSVLIVTGSRGPDSAAINSYYFSMTYFGVIQTSPKPIPLTVVKKYVKKSALVFSHDSNVMDISPLLMESRLYQYELV